MTIAIQATTAAPSPTLNKREQAQLRDSKRERVLMLHTMRYMRYRDLRFNAFKSQQVRESKATEELLAVHRAGKSVARHISMVIGEDHEAFVKMLFELEEPCYFINF